MDPRPLELSEDRFRMLAHRVVDEVSRYLSDVDKKPIRPGSTGAETLALFAQPAPEVGLGAAAFDELASVITHSRTGHGRFLG
jgi:hypothetical protein